MKKTIRIFITLTVSLIYLFGGFAIPGVYAQTPTPTTVPTTGGPAITFHVLNSQEITSVPADSVNQIQFGEHFTIYNTGTDPGAAIQNLCTGTDCAAQTIYFQISATITWHTQYNDVLTVSYVIGSANHLQSVDKGYCGGAYDPGNPLFTDSSGTCSFTDNGSIDAGDIPTDPAQAQEAFLFTMTTINYGGYTVDMDYTVIFSTSPISNGDCSDQWLTGTRFAIFNLASTDSVGVDISSLGGWPTAGSWIRIEVANGTYWNNNGTGPAETDLAVRIPSLGGQPSFDWHPLVGDQFTGCSNGTNYYYQIGTPWSVFLRVNDLDGNWSNTGTLSINLYKTTYSPLPTGCDANYTIGSQIETRSLSSTDPNGIAMGTGISDVSSGGEIHKGLRYLALETNIGPHWNGGSYTYSGEINTGSSWFQDINLPTATCVVPLDEMGHVRVYFPYSSDFTSWKFRGYDVDGIWSNNQGQAGYTLYYADLLQVYIPGNPIVDCSATYSHVATGTSITLNANNSIYHEITVTGGSLYAIETSAGPWYDNGTATYGVAISADGVNWDTLYDYPYALCATATDGNHYIVYFQALAGTNYYLRVDDPGGVFSDNTGSIVATIYGATYLQHPWSVCTDSYIISQMNIPLVDRTFAANLSQGISIPYIESGKTYALEISDESYWNSSALGGENRFDAEISNDGGATWQTYQTANFVTCAVILADDPLIYRQRFRIVFPASGNYRIRAHNILDFDYPLHTGNLVYILAEVNPSDVIPPPGNPPYTPPGWETSCYGVCNRPASLIAWQSISFSTWGSIFGAPLGSISFPLPDVGGWVDYDTCAIRSYITWCPEHTAALEGIPGMFQAYEPFGTIVEFQNAMSSLNERLDSLTTTGGEGTTFTPYSVIYNAGGGEGDNTWQGFLPVLKDTSPWVGGKIQWNNGNGLSTDGPVGGASGAEYTNYCEAIFNANLGTQTASGLCAVVTLARAAPVIWIFIQLFVDVGALAGFIKYVMAKWIDLAGSA